MITFTEKIYNEQLHFLYSECSYIFFMKNNLILSYQSGYKARDSSINQLLSITHVNISALASAEESVLVSTATFLLSWNFSDRSLIEET